MGRIRQLELREGEARQMGTAGQRPDRSREVCAVTLAPGRSFGVRMMVREQAGEGGWRLTQRFWAALMSKREPLMVTEQETRLSESRAHLSWSLLYFPVPGTWLQLTDRFRMKQPLLTLAAWSG